MKCKTLAFIILLLTFAAIVSVSCNRDGAVAPDLYDAVPASSSIVVSSSDIDSVTSLVSRDNSLVQLFYSPKSGIKMPLCTLVDSLARSGMFGGHLEKDGVIAVRKDGNCGLCQLYVRRTDLADKGAIAAIVDSLKHLESIESRIYNDVEIIRLRLHPSEADVSFGFVNGYVVFSSSAKYLEDALQCSCGLGQRLKDDANFEKALASSGKKELANVFLNSVPAMEIFSSELFDDNFFVKNMKSVDGWFSFDIVSGKPLSFSGIEFPQSDSSAFAAFVKSQPSVEFGATSVIPEKAAAYILMSFADAQKYDEALSEYMASNGKLKERNSDIESINSAFGFDAKSKFYSLVKREFAYVVCDNSYNPENGAFVICGLQSQSAAELELRNMVSDENVMSLGDGTSANVFKMPCKNIPSALFGDLFGYCTGSYVCCIGNYMVFANSVDDLRSLYHDVALNNTMKASISHREFLDKFSSSSTMFFYYSFGGTEIMKRIVSRQYSSDIDKCRAGIGDNGVVGIQFKHLDDLVYCNVSLGESDGKQVAGSDIIWETNIGVSIATKPYIVKNHDTEAKEVILQDINNQLYLFDFSGKEIWRVQLDGRIISPIVQVDAYKNGKLQYLFSTKDKIYLVDRLGNFISKYPLALRAEATAPISVFDYEGNRNYRIFAPCSDNKVYVYDIEGNLLKGWDFAGTETNVTSEISHYVISKEDFIAFHDDYKAYLLARNGSSKMEFLTGFKFSRNPIFCDVSGSPKFVATDEAGIVRRLYKSGKQDSLALGNFSAAHYFAMKDIDADGRPDYVFADSSRLSVYGNGGKLLFENDFGSQISSPSFYQFCGQTRIGVTSADGKLYLVNMNGTMYDGLPLDGETQFSICEVPAAEAYGLVAGLRKGRLVNYRITK